MNRILFLQFTNPAAYPPLQHSSRLLANRGWKVLFLGIRSSGADGIVMERHPNIEVRQLGRNMAGWRGKALYTAYVFWCLAHTIRFRPNVVYASDTLAAPVTLFLLAFTRARAVYHEHDVPPLNGGGAWQRLIRGSRASLLKRADLTVVPNAERAQHVRVGSHENGAKIAVVMNCPSRDECVSDDADRAESLVVYHGSIVPARLPMTVIRALRLLPANVRLMVIGYETAGFPNYSQELRCEAEKDGVGDRLEMIGIIPERADLLRLTRRASVGLALMPMDSNDPNETTMAGASNKAFEYLASGCRVVVSGLPDWERMFVDHGFAVACDPRNPESVAVAIERALSQARNPTLHARVQAQLQSAWNYESQFEKVYETLVH